MTISAGEIRSVLIARGAFAEMYEPAWRRALEEIGVNCHLFDAHALTHSGILGRIERRVLWGPGVKRLRRELIALTKRVKPDVTVLYQGHYYDEDTVEALTRFSFVVGYHNDDPFGPQRGMLRYRHLLAALPAYHGFHVYRECNTAEALAIGARRIAVLRPYYIPWMDYPRSLTSEEHQRFGCDLVFAGHVENDMRVACLSEAAQNGITIKIYGEDRYWKSALPAGFYSRLAPIPRVVDDDYRRALCGARIAACFFSKWNRDTYTRRAFEIPACGVLLLSERTSDMQEMFREDVEAVYFSSPQEFVDKASYYLKHDIERSRIANAGRERVITAGHDIYSRMRQWLSDVNRWREEAERSAS